MRLSLSLPFSPGCFALRIPIHVYTRTLYSFAYSLPLEIRAGFQQFRNESRRIVPRIIVIAARKNDRFSLCYTYIYIYTAQVYFSREVAARERERTGGDVGVEHFHDFNGTRELHRLFSFCNVGCILRGGRVARVATHTHTRTRSAHSRVKFIVAFDRSFDKFYFLSNELLWMRRLCILWDEISAVLKIIRIAEFLRLSNIMGRLSRYVRSPVRQSWWRCAL